MDHQIQGREHPAVPPSPVDLSDPALEPLADHRLADFPARGDAETRMPELVRCEIDDGQSAMAPPAGPVALEIVGPPPQPLRGEQPLPGPGGGLRHQTLRRLRPLARRRLITARPLRVRIRTRKPWVRLRLRLFG